jgi:hypothetical protein
MKMLKNVFFCFLALLIFITGCGGTGPGKPAPTMYQKTFSVGSPVSFDRQVFTVTKLQRNYKPPENDLYSARVPAGKEWIIIAVKIENNAKHTFTFHKENIFLEDDKKNIYRGSPVTGNLNRPGFIPMGDWMHGGLLYEIPAGLKGLTLYYQPKYLQKKNQIIAVRIA